MALYGSGVGSFMEGFIGGRRARNEHRREKQYERAIEGALEDKDLVRKGKKRVRSRAIAKWEKEFGPWKADEPFQGTFDQDFDPLQWISKKLFGGSDAKSRQAIDPNAAGAGYGASGLSATPGVASAPELAPEERWDMQEAGTLENPYEYDSYAPAQVQTFRYADGGTPDPQAEEEMRAAMAAEELQNLMAREESEPPVSREAIPTSPPDVPYKRPAFRTNVDIVRDWATREHPRNEQYATQKIAPEVAQRAEYQRQALPPESPTFAPRPEYQEQAKPPSYPGRANYVEPEAATRTPYDSEPWRGPHLRPGTAPSGVTAPTGGVSPNDPAAIDIDAEKAAAPSGVQPQAVPVAKKPAEEPFIDFSKFKVPPKQVPNMTTDQWKDHRRDVMEAAIEAGMDGTSALELANDKVTLMQQKGFDNYANQALLMMEAGNIEDAMTAMRAAWQYFPNGTDVEFGTHKDRNGQLQIIGFGRDEHTEELIPGSEMVMNPERLAVLREQAKNPNAWRSWTMDHLKHEQDVRAYEETEKPYREMMGDYYAKGGSRAGLGSYDREDMARDHTAFVRAAEEIALLNPADADALVNVMAQRQQRYPGTPPGEIIDWVKSRYRQKQGTQ